jgi:branched-chain amino acid transport system substrate-binding protein
MHQRFRFRVSAFAIAALVVTACQAGAPTPGVTSAPATAPATAAATTQATTATGEPIRIGAAMALTGDFSPDSELVYDGYEFAVDVINQAGGINVGGQMRLIELVVRDDGSDREVSARLLEQLIAEDEVDLLLAPWGSGNTNAVAPINERYGRPMIAPLAASDSIWEQGYDYLFGMLPLGSDNERPMVQMAQELGAERIALITTDDLFPGLAHEGAVDEAETLGLEVVLNEIYPPGTVDVGPLITRLQDAEPDFVIAPVDVADAIVLIRQLKERDYRPPGLALSGATFVPDFLDNVGDDAEGLFGIVHWFPTLPWSDDIFGTAEEYAQAFEEAMGYAPTHDNAAASAAVEVLKLAVEAAGSLEQDAVRDALRQIELDTFFGPVNFDDTTGRNIGLEYPIQMQDMAPVIVYPEEAAGADPVYPITEWSE